MTFDQIRFALGVNGVKNGDVETLIAYHKKQGKNCENLDDMLVQMGYEKVFTDEFFGWIDAYNGDSSTEKIRHKHEWQN